jgi:hypothetical protein
VGCANSNAMESPKWNEAFLVECVSGISHVTPKLNVSSGMCQKNYQLYLILNNSQKNCNVN